jgi:hypothetical protein
MRVADDKDFVFVVAAQLTHFLGAGSAMCEFTTACHASSSFTAC